MLIYLLVVLIVCFIALIMKKKNLERKWTFFDAFILLFLVVFSGIRFNVGSDYESYYYIYNNIISSTFSLDAYNATTQEFGFYLLSYITKKISDSPYGIFWVSAVITYVPIYIRMKKDSKDFAFSILLFFLLGLYTIPFNTIRQWIAIAINFYSLRYIDTNKRNFIILNCR
ncbi:EpsG family protein [Anoxybacillus flavithermus]|uniref:EpsG family protein n=1 Tax=Anoxybacillus flavithermus TaxID=33934 RepID=UPI00054CF533